MIMSDKPRLGGRSEFKRKKGASFSSYKLYTTSSLGLLMQSRGWKWKRCEGVKKWKQEGEEWTNFRGPEMPQARL